MTREHEDQLYAEAGRIHERARGQNRDLNAYEKERLAELSLLLAGGDQAEVHMMETR